MAFPTVTESDLPAAADWREADLADVEISPLAHFTDERGWLAEFFRSDELDPQLLPAMGYVSATHPGVTRGPHEHVEQTDLFLFISGRYRLYMWDARPESPTFGCRQTLEVGEAHPVRAIIPPGIVHAYRNVGETDAIVINCPNRLYAGEGKSEPVDEIRHEERPDSPFLIDE